MNRAAEVEPEMAAAEAPPPRLTDLPIAAGIDPRWCEAFVARAEFMRHTLRSLPPRIEEGLPPPSAELRLLALVMMDVQADQRASGRRVDELVAEMVEAVELAAQTLRIIEREGSRE